MAHSLTDKKPLAGNNVINQIAFVLRDIEQASEAFAQLLGIPKPKWFLTGDREVSKVTFRGQPSDSRSKLVFMNTPTVQIELIEPDQEPGTISELLDTVGEGIHHFAFEVDSIKDKLESKYMFINTPLLQLELIEPGDSPNTWKKHLETQGEGVHHISFLVNDMDEKVKLMEKRGYPIIQSGNFWNSKGRYAYMDNTATYKVIIELLERF
ncbi:VOC family protein [Neobacillus vireti]|uniref:VOC family protein n=1 Tax=Neobacillus vireti TaxID=220686 RepID=UPI002FFE372A